MENPKFYKQTTLPNLTKEGKDPLIPSGKIGPYKVETLLSKGGMSYLYLAIHPDGFPLVVKVLSPKYMTHPEMTQQFLKEAEIIALTDHPNIIKLYGQGKWEGGLYIGMEFVQGISLKQFIVQQTLSVESALDIILQVSYALLHLHTQGVIHRDLKPENILITEGGQVKVIDFGIAQLTQDEQTPFHSRKGQFLGTPSYMSLEQRKNPLKVSFATDIYSLGVITFELIVGKLSYGSIQLSLLPEHLREIVEKAVAPSVEERCQDIVDFITAISRYLKTLPLKQKKGTAQNNKEMWKELEQTHKDLLVESPPKWNLFDLGFAKWQGATSLCSYHDFFRFTDDSYLILSGKLLETQMMVLAEIALLKGMVQALIHKVDVGSTPFTPLSFMKDLNTLLCKQKEKKAFSFHLLYLTPSRNQFSFISSHFQPLVHLASGSTQPRFLDHQNPPLGTEPHCDFYETSENWDEGDLLIVHSFYLDPSELKQGEMLEEAIRSTLPSLAKLSAQMQAQGLLSELSKSKIFSDQKSSQAVLTVQRIT